MSAYVLVAEDDRKQAELIRRYLENEGHTCAVVHDGGAAVESARRQVPDLLILDAMMPHTGGWDVLRIVRGDATVAGLPILMLTARAAEEDLLQGLDLGADDYMTKPYSPRELMARTRALLRRSQHRRHDQGVLRVGDVVVDLPRHQVTVRGQPVECTPGEFQVLSTMAAEPGRVFTRQQLLNTIHGTQDYVTARTVDMHVMNLRRKIETDARRPARLLTVYGVGYKLMTEGPAGAPRP
ncbi:response regulator transcription factor [Streptomyces sp. NPDC048182]|uniref:response regulator transcription factor n=1 Tax=Streptomyces sp. NPDC048182 TaxID=3365507 RepID=UPI00372217F2